MRTLVWFRDDLRLKNNPALYYAAQRGEVLLVYIDDEHKYPWPLGHASKHWLSHALLSLKDDLQQHHATLHVMQGNPENILPQLARENNCQAIYYNDSFDRIAIQQVDKLKQIFLKQGIEYQGFHANFLFHPQEIYNQQGKPFTVFTSFLKACLKKKITSHSLPTPKSMIELKNPKFSSDHIQVLSGNELMKNLTTTNHLDQYWKISEKDAHLYLKKFIKIHLSNYATKRDFPSAKCTSKLSPYLRFGQITPLQILETIELLFPDNYEKFLAELLWRDFCYYSLFHFPDLPLENFDKKFNGFHWDTHTTLLNAWQKGQTGYPIIDAGMRQLLKTGWMHNRIRMLTASFLIKDLLIDWRIGAHWFWEQLVDADLAINSFNWQWVAGTGISAMPFFRIFNPVTQSKQFDPTGTYIKQWVPELQEVPIEHIHTPWIKSQNLLQYPTPIVEHSQQRQLALASYHRLQR